MDDEEFHYTMNRLVNSGRLVAVWVDVPDHPKALPALVAPEHEDLFWFAKPLPPPPPPPSRKGLIYKLWRKT